MVLSGILVISILVSLSCRVLLLYERRSLPSPTLEHDDHLSPQNGSFFIAKFIAQGWSKDSS